MNQIIYIFFILLAAPLATHSATLKKLSVDIAFSDFVDPNGGQAISIDTRIPANEWSQVTGGSLVQVRLYQKDEGGARQELLNNEFISLEGPVDSLSLGSELVCASPGNKSLSVWLSVRDRRANFPKNEDYENIELTYSYTCESKNSREAIEMASAPRLELIQGSTPNNSQTYGLSVDLNPEQFRKMKKMARAFQLKLFIYRENDPDLVFKRSVVRLPVGRNHSVASAKPVDFEIPVKSLCDEAAIYWSDIYQKKIQLSCDLSAISEIDSARDFKVLPFQCPKWEILCPAK